jgi:hypothetical protein
VVDCFLWRRRLLLLRRRSSFLCLLGLQFRNRHRFDRRLLCGLFLSWFRILRRWNRVRSRLEEHFLFGTPDSNGEQLTPDLLELAWIALCAGFDREHHLPLIQTLKQQLKEVINCLLLGVLGEELLLIVGLLHKFGDLLQTHQYLRLHVLTHRFLLDIHCLLQE